MKRVSTPKTIRQQQEDGILRDIAAIRANLSHQGKALAADAIDASKTHQPAADKGEAIDKKHIMSVISHFTALKRAVKF